jgi:hypothetical protein
MTHVAYVHWLCSIDGRPLLTDADRAARWGRICDTRRGKVIYSSELTHPRTSFARDTILIANARCRMRKTKDDRERDCVPELVHRFKCMREASFREPCNECVPCEFCGKLADDDADLQFQCSCCLSVLHTKCDANMPPCIAEAVSHVQVSDITAPMREPRHLCRWCCDRICVDRARGHE